jgi:polysaccharide biosynthesis protein PslJ
MIEWHALIQDLLESGPLRGLLFNRRRWLLLAVGVLLLIPTAVVAGWLIAELGALVVAVLVAAGVYAIAVLWDLEYAYLGVIGVCALLPFGSLPFSFGFTPTFLDLALLALFGAWLLAFLLGEEQRIIATPVGASVFAFALMAIAAFVAGLSHGALTSYLVRHFAEVLLSIALFFLVVNTVRDVGRLERLMRWFILLATAAAVLGMLLYFLPEQLVIRMLSALERFGYPSGPGVIWHIRDDPTLMKRAVSTSVHPNVLGSLLNFGLAMLVPQILTKRPILPHWAVVLVGALLGACLVLTVSRSAMLGIACAVLILSVMRYRKLLPLLIMGLVIFLVLPVSRNLVGHFTEGFQGADLSTQMRFGEYKDTLTLIQRYPFLGVGFAGAPDIDIYVAVASLYLIIAAQMGLVGLAAFLVVLGMVIWRFWRNRNAARAHPALEPLWYGIHAAILGGAVSGIFDHYFFSIDFHHSVTLFWLMVGLATAATELVLQADPGAALEPEHDLAGGHT